jgi:hypothetical protein
MVSAEPRKWGKAGERLDPVEAARRAARAVAERQARQERRAESDRVAREKWAAGLLVPNAITLALDLHGLQGPEVDVACGAREPEVDLWEAGKLYPRWDQVLKLAALTERPPIRFMAPLTQISAMETSMRFHLGPGEVLRMPVYSFSRYALNQARRYGVNAL